jgi:D-xylose transport system ATP-binding protein
VGKHIPGLHLLDEPAMEQRTLELLDSLGVTTIGSVRTEVAQLSGGQRQAVAIARSLLGEPKVVLLDEPTAALGIVQTREILNLIERLRERGLGVVVISHNLANVFEVADRIVVLRLGRAVASLDADETKREDVVGAITGAEFGDVGGERTTEEQQL